MEHFYARLNELAGPTPLQGLLRDTLRHVCDHAHIFDRIVSKDSPFFKEFFESIKQGDVSEDDCFSLLECLIIFCREKALRTQHERAPVVEHGLFSHFEHSGVWEDPAQQTLMGQWYWSVLPLRYAQA